ncbi:DUF2892 domain-containing protein [Thalassobacillus sp. CUG 92003]|uniref:YgaP family membrane protein n=1 Tax=Thalassobacillus sp. CUG 92003 TaxID=2736641 RepID=UPI00210543BD|nr:DUF2892 domain-containing protein [Thalassobacillus sp. CUG 92003]
MTQPNIGIINAMVRISAGLTMVSLFSVRLTKRPGSIRNYAMVGLGAMKVAEGVVRYCPVTAMVEHSQKQDELYSEEPADLS